MVKAQRFAGGAWLTLACATAALSAQTAELSATTPASSNNPLSISCSAASAPSETGTPNYYVVLKAQYANHGPQPIKPVIIRFDFHDSSGKVIASHTVIDSNGLAPQYANGGQWQSVGYPASATSLTCAHVVSK
jgi:hypothetical protein